MIALTVGLAILAVVLLCGLLFERFDHQDTRETLDLVKRLRGEANERELREMHYRDEATAEWNAWQARALAAEKALRAELSQTYMAL